METKENKELMAFYFEGQPVRKIAIDGEPWFVAKDVCDVLELENVTEALRNMPDDERFALSTTEGKTLGFDHATAGVNLINEPGLYRLIFQSRKPDAERFKRWVFYEVLPAIRKTGHYAVPELKQYIDEYINWFEGELDSLIGQKIEEAVIQYLDTDGIIKNLEERLHPWEKQMRDVRVFLEKSMRETQRGRDRVDLYSLWHDYCQCIKRQEGNPLLYNVFIDALGIIKPELVIRKRASYIPGYIRIEQD